jgi:hypothetical protein
VYFDKVVNDNFVLSSPKAFNLFQALYGTS